MMNVNRNSFRRTALTMLFCIPVVFFSFSAQQRENNQGLGAASQTSTEYGDNEYDAYRKRMMLAYRFRPNPLVRINSYISEINVCLNFYFSRIIQGGLITSKAIYVWAHSFLRFLMQYDLIQFNRICLNVTI